MRESYHMFDLRLEMLRVVEEAAIASARTMGMDGAMVRTPDVVKFAVSPQVGQAVLA
jgi:fructose-1,6-bisphosphatase/sedoheptulose 1,7-bisphosphatase-like protein